MRRRVGEIIEGPDDKRVKGIPRIKIVALVDIKLIQREAESPMHILIFFRHLTALVFYNEIFNIAELIRHIPHYF